MIRRAILRNAIKDKSIVRVGSSNCSSSRLSLSTSTTSTTTTPTNSSSSLPSIPISKKHPTHLIFGANTDVGKTVLSTTLIRSNIQSNEVVNYIKPLQCGGGDETFINNYVNNNNISSSSTSLDSDNYFKGHTLHYWDMPASPHLASRLANKPASDEEVISSIQMKLNGIHEQNPHGSTIWIETAGGVLSPASASPYNTRPRHASGKKISLITESSWGWSTQGDLYQPFHLPVILVGDGRLGGISATLSAMESLLIRGYDIHAIALIEDSADLSGHGSNLPALQEYASRCMALRSGSGRALLSNVEKSIVSFPAVPSDMNIPLNEWFESQNVVQGSLELKDFLRTEWENHVDIIGELREKGKKVLWWPFTQHQGHDENKVTATQIDGASGDNFSIIHPPTINTANDDDNGGGETLKRTAHFDSCASWWTQGMGHGESSLALAAASAAGRFGHVIFPDAVHEPATKLAETLVNSDLGPGKGWASRVFFTDDGSTAMEVAIKMGMRKYAVDHKLDYENISQDLTLTVLAQKDCYHGDTLGVMDVAEPSIFNEGQHPWYEPKGLFLDYPTVRYKEGIIGINFPMSEDEMNHGLTSLEEVFNVNDRLQSTLYAHYCSSIESEWDLYECDNPRRIGSVVIEPLLLGAGGMKFVDPLWQRALMEVAKSKNVPIIFDEVASGLYRLGVKSCAEVLQCNPDIASYAKLLTGGLIPMSVTLATEDVFNTFLGDSKAEALLHGHSYTAHPVGCVSSIHSLETYHELYKDENEKEDDSHNNSIPHGLTKHFDEKDVVALSHLPLVQECMSLGTVLAVTIKPDSNEGSGYVASSRSIPIVKKLFENGVYARPLGNVVYLMVSPLTSRDACSRLCTVLGDAIEEVGREC